LNFPDFRSAERSFSLLAQVAGRAGRAELPGRVVVQTYSVDNPVLQCAIDHDYLRFAKQELPLRQLLFYPPFGYLVNLVLSGLDRYEVERAAELLVGALGLQAKICGDIEVLGPAPCPLFRLRNRYRMRRLLLYAPQWKSDLGVRLTLVVDVDPVDMM
jgi:primosomal protein N' (replication factor Y)